MKVEEEAPEVPALVSQETIKRRLLRGGGAALGIRVGAVATALASNAILARLLTPSELGAYFLLVSVVTFTATLAKLGLDRGVTRFVAESVGVGAPGRVRTLIRRAVLYLALSSGLVLVAYRAGIWEWLAGDVFDSPGMAGLGLLAGLLVTARVFQVVFAESLRGFHRIGLATLLTDPLGKFLGLAGFGALFVTVREISVETAVVVVVASTGIGAMVGAVLLHGNVRKLAPAEPVEWGTLLKVAIPILLTNLTLIFHQQVGMWILGIYKPEAEVALFGAAQRLVQFVALPLWVVNQFLPPTISELYAQGRTAMLEKTLRGASTLAGLPALLALGLLILGAGAVLEIVYGAAFGAAAAILVVLSVGQVVGVLAGSCQLTLMMSGHERVLFLGTVVSVLASVTTSLLLVERYGGEGVAVGMAAGLSLQNVMMVLLARRFTGMWTHFGDRSSMMALLGKG